MMKITAGLGSIDEYVRFAKAGGDEFFCGYVPFSWTEKYGTVMPLNRREVLCYNVQLGAFSELEILASMIEKYGKKVHLTFNSLYYIPEQYPKIAEIIRQCMNLGFKSYIIADPALIVYLRRENIRCEIHLSGETGEVNREMVNFFEQFDLKRVIFHRKNTFEDMKVVTAGRKTEFEAFVLNEMCQFSGAFCNSLHCDEMGYLCRVPYWLKNMENGKEQQVLKNRNSEQDDAPEDLPYDEDGYLCGAGGCGLCALYHLQDAGITHLKLVGRGNYADHMEKDIRNLKRALQILEHTTSEKEFREKMKGEIFPEGCSGNCYYRF